MVRLKRPRPGDVGALESRFPSHHGSIKTPRSTMLARASGKFPSHHGSIKTLPFDEGLLALHRFPSHHGSIKTIIESLEAIADNPGFHPTMVRLKRDVSHPRPPQRPRFHPTM